MVSMKDILLKLDKDEKASLGNIRCLKSVVAAEDGDHIWIRLKDVNDNIDHRLKQLPVKSTFTVDDKNQLFLSNGLTPVDVLKEMNWIPIQSFITVDPPVSNIPGQTKSKVEIKLIPSITERPGTALLTDLITWKEYAETASAIRLATLKFAVSGSDEVLILGSPLPSLPGKEYWQQNNCLLPCGYEFEIPFVANFLQSEINPSTAGLILFNSNSEWQIIDHSLFVEAKRSSIRLTNNAATSK